MGMTSVCLLVLIYPRTVLPMGTLENDPDCRHMGDPGAVTDSTRHCDGDPDSDVSKCPEVGLPPLGGKAGGQVFQHGLSLSAQQAVQ